MATLRNKRKLAAVTRETQEEHPRSGYISQVSEEIEGRVSKKLSQEFSMTESRIFGALSNLDEFLLNQQLRTHSQTVPGTFRNTDVENQGTNEDDSRSDPHPEAGIFRGQTTQNFGPKDCRDNDHLGIIVPHFQQDSLVYIFVTLRIFNGKVLIIISLKRKLIKMGSFPLPVSHPKFSISLNIFSLRNNERHLELS